MPGVTSNFASLIRHRFLASDVLSACVLQNHTLTNIISKSPLTLCSDSAGQGRAREFCLIDVYQIRLFEILRRITGNVDLSARLMDHVLFAAHWHTMVGDGWIKIVRDVPYDIRQALCSDPASWPQAYRHRDIQAPLRLVVDLAALDLMAAPSVQFVGAKELIQLDRAGGAAVFIRLTEELARIDDVLSERLRERAADA